MWDQMNQPSSILTGDGYMMCAAVFCNSPPTIFNGVRSPNVSSSQPYATIVNYQCLGGRRFEDGQSEKNVLCTGNGKWNDTWLTCERKLADAR